MSKVKKETAVSVYTPSLAEFRELAGGEANLIPVYREFAADLETPVSVYLKLMDEFGRPFKMAVHPLHDFACVGRIWAFIGQKAFPQGQRQCALIGIWHSKSLF